MGIDDTQLESIVEELREVAKAKSPSTIADLTLHELETLYVETSGSVLPEGILRASALSEWFANAASRLDEQWRESAMALLGNVGDGRGLNERGRAAGGVFGFGYDAFRKKAPNGSSRLEEVLMLTAHQLQATDQEVLGEPPSDSFDDETEQPEGSRVPAILVAFAISVGLIVALVVLLGSGDEVAGTRTADVLIDEKTTSSLAQSSTTLLNGSTSSVAKTPDEVEVIEVTSGPPCHTAIGEHLVATEPLRDSTVEAFRIAYEDAGGTSLGCPMDTAVRRGSLYWQRIELNGQHDGGIIIRSDDHASVMNIGQFQSFMRIGGGDGSRSEIIGGLPDGDAFEGPDGWEYPLDSDVLLIGELEDSTYYWLPQIVGGPWTQAGRSRGIHGGPAGSPRLSPEGLRQDFENGYFVLLPDGELVWRPVSDVRAGLPKDEDLPGRIISAADGTAWLVDADLRRWWIPDAPGFFCAGGDPNVLAEGLAGYAIHTLEIGGTLRCPPQLFDVHPSLGVVYFEGYCHVRYSTDVRVERESLTARRCVRGESTLISVEAADVCEWQYGLGAELIVDGEDLRCRRVL